MEAPPARGGLARQAGTAILVAVGLALPGMTAYLLRPVTAAPAREHPAVSAPAASAVAPTGPVRICVLKFRDINEDSSLELALAEAVITDIGAHPGLRIVEREQLDLPMKEQDFHQSDRVDPETRARLGRLIGAEVVVLGSIQRSGPLLRVAARFVHVETGEVLDTARVEGPAQQPFEVQDALTAQVRALLPALSARLRP
ncbi:CsgG/HfaB family protein [Myxococcus sp. K38C18041901]|uniref:CsgG/HfaB family protein n=1 Tax=Myxococcus guangdongensis TaxID=2906760 RepID=UPI0020A6FFEA|nr:CsgG/HfaB family protein [Myxococcus guangdongensis]MCP3061598.1 CsgG/HfaB family protein [Myxococcus guangdongensis]